MIDDHDRLLYTGAAYATMARATRYAADRGRSAPTQLDLLRALVDENATGMATGILGELRIRTADIRVAMVNRPGTAHSDTETLAPVSEGALPENSTLRIGTDHLVLELLSTGGAAAKVLTAHGITMEDVRAARAAVVAEQCYGCIEGEDSSPRYPVDTAVLPASFAEALATIDCWRAAKEQAMDAGNFGRAARMRHGEQKACDIVTRWDESTARNLLGVALDEILRLRAVADRLTDHLHHGHTAG